MAVHDYTVHTPGVRASGRSTVKLGPRDTSEAGAALFITPEAGGRLRFDAGGYFTTAPDLVAEVAAHPDSLDRNLKFRAYERHGVREYIVFRVYDGAVDWFVNTSAGFAPIAPDPADGLLKSRLFRGLWLDTAAFAADACLVVLAALERGVATPEHAAFVARLRSAQGGTP